MFIVQEIGRMQSTGIRHLSRKKAINFAQEAAKLTGADVYVWDGRRNRTILRIRKPKSFGWV